MRTLTGAPINVNVGTPATETTQTQTVDIMKTGLWILGGFLVAKQFAPRRKKSN